VGDECVELSPIAEVRCTQCPFDVPGSWLRAELTCTASTISFPHLQRCRAFIFSNPQGTFAQRLGDAKDQEARDIFRSRSVVGQLIASSTSFEKTGQWHSEVVMSVQNHLSCVVYHHALLLTYCNGIQDSLQRSALPSRARTGHQQ
jgi:hypothetical protein